MVENLIFYVYINLIPLCHVKWDKPDSPILHDPSAKNFDSITTVN